MKTALIKAVGAYLPDHVLDNQQLSKMVDTNSEWIIERTGIHERRILKDKNLASSDMAVKAVQEIFDSGVCCAEDIDLLICATTTPDRVFPATANIISEKLGIKNAFSFDVSAACSGFLYALDCASNYIKTGQKKNVIVVGVDQMSSIIDYSDRATSIIFGDGAGAVLLQPATDKEAHLGIIDSCLYSDGIGEQYLHQKAGGSLHQTDKKTVDARQHFVYQNGAPVFKWAVSKMAEVVEEIMQRNKLSSKDIDWLVAHQANKRIIDATAKRAGLSDDKVMLNIDRYGNTTAATIPLCLYDYKDKLNKEDQLILCAFGGGFTWGSIYLRWAI